MIADVCRVITIIVTQFYQDKIEEQHKKSHSKYSWSISYDLYRQLKKYGVQLLQQNEDIFFTLDVIED